MGWTVVSRVLTTLSLLLILMAAQTPVLHQHRGDVLSFYDADCPLLQLIASRSEASPVQRVDLAYPLPATELVVLSVLPGTLAAPIPRFEPRGPPLAA